MSFSFSPRGMTDMTELKAVVFTLSCFEEGVEVSADLAEELAESRFVCARDFEVDRANLELYVRYYLKIGESYFLLRALADHGAEKFYAQPIRKVIAREDGIFEDIEETSFPSTFIF